MNKCPHNPMEVSRETYATHNIIGDTDGHLPYRCPKCDEYVFAQEEHPDFSIYYGDGYDPIKKNYPSQKEISFSDLEVSELGKKCPGFAGKILMDIAIKALGLTEEINKTPQKTLMKFYRDPKTETQKILRIIPL